MQPVTSSLVGSVVMLLNHLHPPRFWWQPVPVQAHRVGQGHGLGTWWEPAAALTCTSSFTASGVLQNLGSIFKISEIEVQKGLSVPASK